MDGIWRKSVYFRPMSTLSLCDAKTAVIEYARLRFQTSPDWLGFLADVRDFSEQAMGPDAALRFFREPDFGEVHGMVVELAMLGRCPPSYRMITVRLPIELHEALKREAGGRETSLNRLCIAKLLRSIADVPAGVVVVTN